MHAQIKAAIGTLRLMAGIGIYLDLSAGERTPLGNLLNIVYYQTNLCDVIDRDNRFGYPHNGGQHTFQYRGPAGDAVSMIELIKETLLEGKYRLSEEDRQVAHELSYISQEVLALKRKV